MDGHDMEEFFFFFFTLSSSQKFMVEDIEMKRK